MSLSLVKRIKKIIAKGDFIRCHPWRSPFGPAKAVLIFSWNICGKGASNHKLCLMSRRY